MISCTTKTLRLCFIVLLLLYVSYFLIQIIIFTPDLPILRILRHGLGQNTTERTNSSQPRLREIRLKSEDRITAAIIRGNTSDNSSGGIPFTTTTMGRINLNPTTSERKASSKNSNKTESIKIVTSSSKSNKQIKSYLAVAGGEFGRLGNRMFQYASLLGIAQESSRRGKPFKVAVEESSHMNSLFMAFNLQLSESVTILNREPVRESKAMAYDTNIVESLKANHNYSVKTYLQSWKYFTNFSREIKNEFTFKEEISDKVHEFLLSVTKKDKLPSTLVGVHVRRGDMTMKSESNKGYAPANPTFIRKALDYFRANFSNVIFIVCSDDIGWCRNNINGTDLIFSEGNRPEVDLAILSSCNHTVVTSGSFGWWAGWLSGGRVVYNNQYPTPGTWLDSICVHGDYYPESWFGLS